MNNLLKQTTKKLVKTGFFHGFDLGNGALSYKHGARVFSLQRWPNGNWYFRSGYVITGKVLQPTYESEYSQLGMVEVSCFNCDYSQRTDNPDFVYRASMSLIGLKF